jgi:hypothetical protein
MTLSNSRIQVAGPATAALLGGLVVALAAASVPLDRLTHHSALANLASFPTTLAFGAVGMVVARKQPRQRMGWILLGIAIGFALNTDASFYTVLDYRLHGGRLPFGWLAVLLQPAWAPAILLGGLAVLLFPDGRLPARRLRVVLAVYLGIGALWMLGAYAIAMTTIAHHNALIDPSGDLHAIDDPTGPAVWWGRAQNIFFPALVASWLLWLAWQVRIYRSATGERRLQLKWLLSGASVFIVSLCALVASGNGSSTAAKAVAAISLLGLAALPISIGVGILKFRLYEIDRLISRTISYAALTALLVAVFGGIVTLTTRVLPFSSPVAVAASTLAAAALFNPLPLRVQRIVDRRFNRACYDADAIVELFASRLRAAVDLEAVQDDLLSAVRVVQPSRASVWIKPRA